MDQNKLLIPGYLADTEVLTEQGWKIIKDVDAATDKVYSLNPDTNEIEAVKVLNSINSFYSGEMCRFANNNMDITASPINKMLVHQRLTKNGEHICKFGGFVAAEDIINSYLLPTANFIWKGEDTEYFILPATTQLQQYTRKEITVPEKKIPIDAWLEFFGFYLADGCYRDHINCVKGNRDYTVSIKQNVQNEEYVLKLIENIGFTCSISNGSTDTNRNYNIHSKQLWEYLQQFGRSHDKYIPREFLKLNNQHLTALFTGYTNGDSSVSKSGTHHFSSVSFTLVEEIQEIILKLFGRITQISEKVDKHQYNDGVSVTYFLHSKLNESENKYIAYGRTKKENINYDDYIYNLKLANNTAMLIRHNGKISWCGSY